MCIRDRWCVAIVERARPYPDPSLPTHQCERSKRHDGRHSKTVVIALRSVRQAFMILLDIGSDSCERRERVAHADTRDADRAAEKTRQVRVEVYRLTGVLAMRTPHPQSNGGLRRHVHVNTCVQRPVHAPHWKVDLETATIARVGPTPTDVRSQAAEQYGNPSAAVCVDRSEFLDSLEVIEIYF